MTPLIPAIRNALDVLGISPPGHRDTEQESLIDAATAPACVVCTGPLDGSPSDDYCGEHCQMVWLAAKAVPLPARGHRVIRYAVPPCPAGLSVAQCCGSGDCEVTTALCWCVPADPCTCGRRDGEVRRIEMTIHIDTSCFDDALAVRSTRCATAVAPPGV